MMYEPISTRPVGAFRPIAAVQGIYYVVTGIWPLVAVDLFQRVTGPKTDPWLVYCVGGLIAVIGATLIASVVTNRISREAAILAIGSALVLAAIDTIFVFRGVISGIYLVDAAAEVALVVWWTMTYIGIPKFRRRIDPLHARGQSVSPTPGVQRSGS